MAYKNQARAMSLNVQARHTRVPCNTETYPSDAHVRGVLSSEEGCNDHARDFIVGEVAAVLVLGLDEALKQIFAVVAGFCMSQRTITRVSRSQCGNLTIDDDNLLFPEAKSLRRC